MKHDLIVSMQNVFRQLDRKLKHLPLYKYIRMWFLRGNKATVLIKNSQGELRLQLPVTIGAVFLVFSPLLLAFLSMIAWVFRWTVSLSLDQK